MNIQFLIDTLKQTNELTKEVKKFTLIVNEKSETQGALFFIPIGAKEFKVLVPSPFHSEIIPVEGNPTHLKILMHKQAVLLK